MEDKIIIKYIKNRKEEGLKMLIEAYGDYINTIVKNNLRDLSYYHGECLNDILLSIWKNIDSFNYKKNTLRNWIGVISKYKTIDYKRKYLKLSIQEFPTDFNINSQSKESEYDFSFIDKNLLKKEVEEEIQELLSHLKEKDKNLFIDYYIEELDVEIIAEKSKTKSFNIYSRLSRGKKKLKEIYSKE